MEKHVQISYHLFYIMPNTPQAKFVILKIVVFNIPFLLGTIVILLYQVNFHLIIFVQ